MSLLFEGTGEMRDSQVHVRRTETTLAQMISQGPCDGDVTIHGGILDLFEAGKEHVTVDGESSDQYYVPLILPTDDPLTTKSHVLVAINDTNLIKTIDDDISPPDHSSALQMRDFLAKQRATMLVATDITGRATYDSSVTLGLSSKGVNIDPGAVVIKEAVDQSASWWHGLEMTVAGGLLAAITVAIVILKFRLYPTGSGWVPTTFAPPSQPSSPTGNAAGQPNNGSSQGSGSGTNSNNSEPAWWDKPGG